MKNQNLQNLKNVFDEENLETLSIAEVAKKVFDLADENGEVYIPEFGDGLEESDLYYKVKLNFNDKEKAIPEIVEDAEKFAEEILSVGKISEGNEKEIKICYNALLTRWENYVGTAYDRLNDTAAKFVAFFTARLFKLATLNASEIVINNERNHLVLAMIIKRFGEILALV